jgi:hypothetical protein
MTDETASQGIAVTNGAFSGDETANRDDRQRDAEATG